MKENSIVFWLQKLANNKDLALAFLIVFVIALMIVPLPPAIIDLLLAINLTISVTMLMLALYISSPLQLSTFPSLLLFTTLFRLSLNIATTKQILLHAEAGHIIETFGKLVIGGNIIVGIVVFIIISIVQFMVIAKGTERVAEVGARFTLDAMPGKQMSIDADLRTGAISAEEAQQKRGDLSMESQLHGGMDGAMKFVKGDAIAGLLISAVNILAGIAVGTLMHGMTTSDAINRFSILGVGDAMISQIPALFISISAGILITRVTNDQKPNSDLGNEIIGQLSAKPKATMLTAIIVGGFALVPGFPPVVFIVISSALGYLGWRAMKMKRMDSNGFSFALTHSAREGSSSKPNFVSTQPSRFTSLLQIRMSEECLNYFDPSTVNEQIKMMKNRLHLEMGLPFPGCRFGNNENLLNGQYEVMIEEIPVHTGNVEISEINANESLPEIFEDVYKVIKRNAGRLVGLQETQVLLSSAEKEWPDLCAETQRAVPLMRISDVLRRIVDEQISIRNIRQILESLILYAGKEKDNAMLTELIRVDIAKGTLLPHIRNEELFVVIFSEDAEKKIRNSVQASPSGPVLTMTPNDKQTYQQQIAEAIKMSKMVVCQIDIRRFVRKLCAEIDSDILVVSYQEVGTNARMRAVAAVEV